MYVFQVSTTLDKMENMAGVDQSLFRLGLQILLAYLILYVLIPYFLNKGSRIIFIVFGLVGVYVAYVLNTAFLFYYLIPQYSEVYPFPPPTSFLQKSTNIFFYLQTIPMFTLPAIILVTLRYYKDQKEVISLREQKKSTELNALKSQLNPHFLFNTMNNLYALALKKSDQTPVVIAKLSEMLDYILYRCNDQYVPLVDEVTLLDNYIALEKLRYGKRVEVGFDHNIEAQSVIAPLLLLTFLENAFKHGVSQEIKTAQIKMSIYGNSKEIDFDIENTVASHNTSLRSSERDSIGLQNVRQQLDLLYPGKHTLAIDQNDKRYIVSLKLTTS